MTYIAGFIAAVPAANKAKYKSHAEQFWPIFEKHGAIAMRECWGTDVPDGKLTSFPMAVLKAEDEVVVFSWVEWPDKASSDRCMAEMMAEAEKDPEAYEMPFDGNRMVWGGFEEILRKESRVLA